MAGRNGNRFAPTGKFEVVGAELMNKTLIDEFTQRSEHFRDIDREIIEVGVEKVDPIRAKAAQAALQSAVMTRLGNLQILNRMFEDPPHSRSHKPIYDRRADRHENKCQHPQDIDPREFIWAPAKAHYRYDRCGHGWRKD